MPAFVEKSLTELAINPFDAIGRQWMLVTAGDEASHNTMTASWGGLGVVWGRNVATCYIREPRYTKQFVDAAERFTLTFFGEQYRDALQLLGTKSGRDGDKIAEAGLTPLYLDGTTAFEEADLILVCRKFYAVELGGEGFVDQEFPAGLYPERDYHTMYIGEIEKALVRG